MKENNNLWTTIYILIAVLLIVILYDGYRFSKRDMAMCKTYEKQSIYIDSINTLNNKIFWLEDSINYLNQEIEYYEYIK
jgi:hypothetical protein